MFHWQALFVYIVPTMPIFVLDKDSLTISTRSLTARIMLTVLVLLLVSPPIYRSYSIFRADRIVMAEKSIESYTRAIAYDPSNAVLWWNRGRMNHYAVEAVDIPQAIRDYQQALSLNPRLGQAWLDLADCYERMGSPAEAESALEKALMTRTYSPVTRWQAGNFFLRRGNLAKMYENFKLASEYDSEKLGIAMELAWKVDPRHEEILEKLIPDQVQANLRYLNFLVSRNELDLARPVWQRSLMNEIPFDFNYTPSLSFAYIDRLLAKSRVTEALHVWGKALQIAGTGLSDNRLSEGRASESPTPGSVNLVWNGSFENEPLRGGFDWRFPDMAEVSFQTDLSNRMERLKSLKVTFNGSNISFTHLYQIIPIPEPGNYTLDFYLRTEGLTTDKTPYFVIQGYPDARGASLQTDMFAATTQWRKESHVFAVSGDCPALRLGLRRDPSSKFDNLIKGSLWLDGISIYRSDGSQPGNPSLPQRR